MTFLTVGEIIDIFVMTIAIGYIFSKVIRRTPAEDYDPLKYFKKNTFIEDIKYGAMIAAPAVVLHEFAHKFVAMAFGAETRLFAPSFGFFPYDVYLFVILLIHIRFPIIFFVGGAVAHSALPALQSAIVSISGPLTNLLIWLGCKIVVQNKIVHRKYFRNIAMMGKLNMFFFVFNILPFPGFDGFNFLRALFALF